MLFARREVFLALLLVSFAGFAEDWTRFRGPNGSGVSKDTGFPAEFGKEKNLIWRTPVRFGKSSPVLTARQIFLTAFENGKLFTQCFDRQTGKLLWERSFDRPREDDVNPLNHPAAITPTTDGENVYVFFKDFGLISYDLAGAVRWKVPLGPFFNLNGLGASPIVAGNSIVLIADQMADSYIAAFDRRNGETRWKAARNEEDSWSTPIIYDPPGVAPVILTAARGQFGAHLVENGKRSFTQQGISPTIVASPVLAQDTLFVFGYGAESPTPFSARLAKFDKNGDGKISPDEYGNDPVLAGLGKYSGNRDLMVTREKWDAFQRRAGGTSRLIAFRLERDPDHSKGIRVRELWRYDKSFTAVVPSPLLYAGVLYVVKNGGVLTSFDPETGAILKTGRIPGGIGGYSASPVAADGRIYIASEDGKVAVLRPGGDWEVIAMNDLGETIHATPALSQGYIYLRTGDALYCFGVKGS
jgi:outer membrane protein assembly factor BamB